MAALSIFRSASPTSVTDLDNGDAQVLRKASVRLYTPSLVASTCCPSHSVQIMRQFSRHIVIDDSLNTLDI